MKKAFKHIFFSKKFIVIFLIFIFSIFLRVATLNKAGRGVDELFCPSPGIQFIDLLKKGDFTNKIWTENGDPPPVCRYIYGLAAEFDIRGFDKNHQPVFKYDLTYARLTSVLFGSASVVLVALLGWEFITPFAGIAGGIIFSMIPSFLGLTQLVSQESIFTFFYTFNIYFFLKYLEKPTAKKAFFVGVLLSLVMLTKLTNIFIVPILVLIYILWYLFKLKKKLAINTSHILPFIAGVIITAIIVWPSLILNFKGIYEHDRGLRFSDKYSPWEWFLGKPVQVPVYYFIVQFIVRTPVLLLVLAYLAFELRPRKNNWTLLIILIWFLVPFLQSFYLFKQQGVRYIVQVYAPFSLLVALGIDYIVSYVSKRSIYRYIFAFAVVIYLAISLLKVSPYYLDYFNELVKGVRGVYKHQLFEIGWWGNGGKDAGNYIIVHAKPGNTVGYKLNPAPLIEESGNLTYEEYKKTKQYDFVVTNYAHYLKVDYNNEGLKGDYEVIYDNYDLVHEVSVDGVPLYKIYKHK